MLTIGVITGLAAMFGWGVADFLQSVPIRKFGSFGTMFITSAFTILCMLPLLVFSPYLQMTVPNLVVMIFNSIISACGFYLSFQAMKKGELAIVTPIMACFGVVVIILSVIFFSFRPPLIYWGSILLLILGIILTSTDLRKIRDIHTVKGVRFAIAAMFTWGIFYTIFEIISGEYVLFGLEFPATNLIALFVWSLFFESLIMIVFVLLRSPPQMTIFLYQKEILANIIASTIYIVVWLGMIIAVMNRVMSTAAMIGSLSPAITTILGLVIYKEKLVLNQKIGIPLILIGLVLISL